MEFRNVFIAIFLGTSLMIGAVLINRARPAMETAQPSADFVRATGRCASCHVEETGAIVHQFERSAHAARGVTCLDCHQVLDAQEPLDHRGFTITGSPTSQNCAACHATQYDQFLRSRHAALFLRRGAPTRAASVCPLAVPSAPESCRPTVRSRFRHPMSTIRHSHRPQ